MLVGLWFLDFGVRGSVTIWRHQVPTRIRIRFRVGVVVVPILQILTCLQVAFSEVCHLGFPVQVVIAGDLYKGVLFRVWMDYRGWKGRRIRIRIENAARYTVVVKQIGQTRNLRLVTLLGLLSLLILLSLLALLCKRSGLVCERLILGSSWAFIVCNRLVRWTPPYSPSSLLESEVEILQNLEFPREARVRSRGRRRRRRRRGRRERIRGHRIIDSRGSIGIIGIGSTIDACLVLAFCLSR
ncbi:uncharacterized protein IWZ02DRAFT_307773 [Phyllosticta citriasiana]|uniref:uncharacterized protein n=1 Tax=Phyllosticta citriasiana TaxID=595635 RepID=UPI0030FD27A5